MQRGIEIYVKGNPEVRAVITRWIQVGLFAAGAVAGYVYCWLQMGVE